MNLEYKRGDKCPCGRSHFRAYEKTKHGLRPKFQSREVFLANQAADLRRQRLKRAQRIATKRGLLWVAQSHESPFHWPRVVDGQYILCFEDGFCLQAHLTSFAGCRRAVVVHNKKCFSQDAVLLGPAPKAVRQHCVGFQQFLHDQNRNDHP